MAISTTSLLSILFCSSRCILFLTKIFSTFLSHAKSFHVFWSGWNTAPRHICSIWCCLNHCTTLCSSKWVRNSSPVSSCEPTPNFMLLELPCRLQLTSSVLSCCPLPPLHGQVTPCYSALKFSPGRTAALSLWEHTEQCHHMSVTAPVPPGKGFWRRNKKE